ncbi:MAG: branched-chain amino acid ABC transporter permease [Candidatus Bathyarchaeia archaeon]|nr:branched-chain amino acid ABC transporter permease [Candidatus Bathyarchaeota archaeon]
MIPLLLQNAIVFANILSLMAISATLALSKTNVPNFAVATFGTIGVYITFTCVKIFRLPLYSSLPFCLIFGGLIGVAIYRLMIKPLRERGATREEIMIATLGLDIFLIAILNIYADYLTRAFKVMARDFTFSAYDFSIAGLNGVFVASTIFFVATMVSLHLIFTKTSLGIALKAMGEDQSLAECQGINTDILCLITWFIVGALPAAAGVFFPVNWISNPTVSLFIVVSVFASCVLGGFSTIYDAAAGSYIIAMAQVLLIPYLANIVGVWILPYGFLVALLIMILTIVIFPKGLYGLPWNTIGEFLLKLFNYVKEALRVKA